MSGDRCDRCSGDEAFPFTECPDCGPALLCEKCIDAHRAEMAEAKAWEENWSSLTSDERRQEIGKMDEHVDFWSGDR